jgi:SsrA-binding protein
MKYAINKKARFDYEILDTLEAGLVLSGQEAKSIRTGNVKLTGSYVTFHKGHPMLTGFHIPKYKFAGNLKDYDPDHSRPLLLKQKEINYIRGKSEEKGLTIVPLLVYNKGRYIKVEIGVAKGKKQYDKKRVLKERDEKREASRAMKYL